MPTTSVALATDSALTAGAGARIAGLGGNAVDIAVAAALAANVSEPLMCSLGGSGFFMIGMEGKAPELIEGADAMPNTDRLPKDQQNWHKAFLEYGDGLEVLAGHASVAVPGVLAAAEMAWKRHGSLPWAEVLAPAIDLATGKQPVGHTFAKWLKLIGEPIFSQQPASRASFFSGDRPLQESEDFRIRHLDSTLRAIAEQGADAFYKGDLAREFAREMSDNGGFITRDDLANYEAIVRKPLRVQSHGFHLALNPPPAVGGAAVGYLIQALETQWREDMTAAERVKLHAQVQSRLVGFRENELADTSFDELAAAGLLGPAKLNGNAAAKSMRAPNTTHLSVVTTDGSMVSVTMSMGYGSGIVIPGLGIACNNSLGEPELNPQGFFAVKAGTRFPSNMAPTLAWHADGRRLAIGSPGASRITTAIAQTWTNVVMEGLSLNNAVAAPRLHIEFVDGQLRAQYEPGIDASLLGPPLVSRPFAAQDRYFGGVKLAAMDRWHHLQAVADNRREGAIEIITGG